MYQIVYITLSSLGIRIFPKFATFYGELPRWDMISHQDTCLIMDQDLEKDGYKVQKRAWEPQELGGNKRQIREVSGKDLRRK